MVKKKDILEKRGEKDISRKAIIVLLILVVLISVLSTWVVLESSNLLNKTPIQKNQAGIVQLVVEGEPTGGGEITLKVVKEKEEKENG